jgi:nucleoside 2-deoxyribosyltransferase
MKVYLAAPYAEMKRMREWERILIAHGHESTAQWVQGAEEHVGKTHAQCAQMDLDDIDRADAVVSMTLALGTMFSSGGRHVEFGYAVAQRKKLVNVNVEGHFENVFHYLPQVIVLPTIHAAAAYLLGVEAKELL